MSEDMLSAPPSPVAVEKGTAIVSLEEPPPLVVVEGFLSSTGDLVWGNFARHLNDGGDAKSARRRTIFVSVGPVSSLHDRACELFYALRGGTVNYGKAHALENSHEQYGRTHAKGLYPGWSTARPLHFVGHSLGGLTLIKLQHLLSIGFFGEQYNADMVLSLNTIQTPFRGTPFVYACGAKANGELSVKKLSAGTAISGTVHLLAYLAPIIPSKALDVHAESRKLAFTESSPVQLFKHLTNSEWAQGRDAGPYDASLGAAEDREAHGVGMVHSRTFYRSWSASITKREIAGSSRHKPTYDMLLNLPLYISSKYLGSFDYSTVQPVPSYLYRSTDDTERGQEASTLPSAAELLGEAYYANDGIVPVFSQWHPYECSRTRCHHFHGTGLRPDGLAPTSCGDGSDIEPGKWYVHSVDGVSHVAMVPLWLGSNRQKMFWREMGEWLRAVDSRAGDVRGIAKSAHGDTVWGVKPAKDPSFLSSGPITAC